MTQPVTKRCFGNPNKFSHLFLVDSPTIAVLLQLNGSTVHPIARMRIAWRTDEFVVMNEFHAFMFGVELLLT